jgi:hypothetical protein
VCLPRWRIRERSPDMEGTGEIKYPEQTKTRTAALRLTEGSVKASDNADLGICGQCGTACNVSLHRMVQVRVVFCVI